MITKEQAQTRFMGDAQAVMACYGKISFLNGLGEPEYVAAGSSGTVYRVKKGGQTYALKVIDCGQDPKKLRNAEYEIFLMERLRFCSGVVPLQNSEILSIDGHKVVFLLEPFVTSFENDYHSHEMTVADVLRLGTDICSALDQCWASGVAHLDVQPKNLFVGRDGSFLLGDFGAGVPVELLGRERQLRGTLSYMAPEVYENREYSQASEIYALAMVLYCLLNEGKLPFMEYGAKETAVMTRLLKKRTIPSLGKDAALDRVLQKALSVDPLQRFKSFQDMGNALREVREQLSPRILRTGVNSAPQSSGRRIPVLPMPIGMAAGALPTVLGGAIGALLNKADSKASGAKNNAEAQSKMFIEESVPFGMEAPVSGAPADWEQYASAAAPGFTAPMAAPGNLFDSDSFANTCALFTTVSEPFYDIDGDGVIDPPSIGPGGNLFDSDSFASTCPLDAPGTSGNVGSGFPEASAPPRVSQVQFSAVAPKEVRKEDYAIIQLFMYEQDFRSAVDEAIAMADTPVQEKRSGFHKVQESTRVKVVLTCPDMVIEDNAQEQLWSGGYLQFDFAICPPEELRKRQILLTATVYFDGIPATRLMLTVKALASYEEDISLARQDLITAFVSYASQDRARVGALVQGMRKARPEMDIFFDVATLRSGEDWEKTLYREILRRDILFLCWSRNALASEWVEREWRYALEKKGIDAIEPIPLEQPDICPPPRELWSKHFNDSLLYIINR